MRTRSSCLAMGLFALALPGFAQSTANIVGTVRDSSGGVVPGARVTVRNIQTDYSQSRQTDSNGAYKLLLLPVGSYNMTVEREGLPALPLSFVRPRDARAREDTLELPRRRRPVAKERAEVQSSRDRILDLASRASD